MTTTAKYKISHLHSSCSNSFSVSFSWQPEPFPVPLLLRSGLRAEFSAIPLSPAVEAAETFAEDFRILRLDMALHLGEPCQSSEIYLSNVWRDFFSLKGKRGSQKSLSLCTCSRMDLPVLQTSVAGSVVHLLLTRCLRRKEKSDPYLSESRLLIFHSPLSGPI